MTHVKIIAEAGVNHNGLRDTALRLVNAAADAGCDIVKFQTFTAERLASRTATKAPYQANATGTNESQLEMLRALELSIDDHAAIIARCRERGIGFMSTPFDLESLDLLVDRFDVAEIKLGSGELTNAPMLLRAARTRRPLILSTGMATLDEVKAALGVIAFGYIAANADPSCKAFVEAYERPDARTLLAERVSLLHCTTEYPAPFEDANLRAMDTLRAAFGLRVGFSDHTPGIALPIAAVARGADIIEKHLTLDCSMSGPDHRASLEPHEIAAMVKAIREVELALGNGAKVPAPSELKNVDVARKSLVAARDIAKGEAFTCENLTVKRPGGGLSPFEYWDTLGKLAERDYQRDERIAR